MDRKLLLVLLFACLMLVEVEGARRRRWGIYRRRGWTVYRRRYYYWGTHCYRRRWGYYRRRRIIGDTAEQTEMEDDMPEDQEPEQEMKPENDFEEAAEQFDDHE
ncbi:uncharacterized protein LOC100177571 [Ciona intestinalis]